MSGDGESDKDDVLATVVAVWKALEGASPQNQGAALSDVIGIWLCQHHAKEGYDTNEVREELLGLIVHHARRYLEEEAAL